MWRSIVPCVALLGCGFQSRLGPDDAPVLASDDAFVPPRDTALDAPPDARVTLDALPAPGIDAAPFDCMARWQAGTPAFSDPVELTALSTNGSERDPWISTDGLLLYFARIAADAGATGDIYQATRTDAQHEFGNVNKVASLNTDVDDGRVSLTRNELTLVIASNRNDDHSVSDIFLEKRTHATDPLVPPDDSLLGAVNNTPGNHYDPFITAKGDALVFAPDLPAPQHIAFSSRGGDGKYGAPMPVTSVSNTSGADADPSLSDDLRLIVFSSTRDGGMGGTDVWYATRMSAGLTVPFEMAKPVPGVNSASNDGDPVLTADGCQLYFASKRNGGDYDLFVATMTP